MHAFQVNSFTMNKKQKLYTEESVWSMQKNAFLQPGLAHTQ